MRISDWSSDVCSSVSPGTLLNLAIPATNPTNPTGEDIVLLRRRLAEPGPRQFFQETDTWQGTAGVRGVLPNDWGWGVAGSFGRHTAIDGPPHISHLQRVATPPAPITFTCNTSPAIPCPHYLALG